MSPYGALFLLSAVVVAVVFVTPTYGSGQTPEELKKEIQEEKALKDRLDSDLANATKTLNGLTARYTLEFAELDVMKGLASDVERELIKVLKDLYGNVTALMFIEWGKNNTLQRVRLTRKKLMFGLKWINEDLLTLNSRKHYGDDQECFNLENEREVSAGIASSTGDLIYDLENELQQLKTRTASVRFLLRRTELEIGAMETLWKNRILQLEVLIKSYGENIKKTEEDIEKCKREIDDLNSTIKRLEEELAQEVELVMKYSPEVDEKRREYLTLARADACYTKVKKQIL